MALSKAAVRVPGKARVCGSAPAPGATGLADADALAVAVAVAVAVARGVTLAVGGADFAEGDPVRAALAFAVGGG
jgi:hypothetical protein